MSAFTSNSQFEIASKRLRRGRRSHSVLSGLLLTVARTPALFKKADVVRLIEAVRAAGLNVAGVEVTPDGTLRVLEVGAARGPKNDFERYDAEL